MRAASIQCGNLSTDAKAHTCVDIRMRKMSAVGNGEVDVDVGDDNDNETRDASTAPC